MSISVQYHSARWLLTSLERIVLWNSPKKKTKKLNGKETRSVSNQSFEKVEIKIRVKLCSDKTFRVELDTFIKLDGIGDVFGHTSKIIQYTASTGHDRLELKLWSRTLRCPLLTKHCMSIRCRICTKWLLISRNDMLLLIKYKSAGVGEFLVWRDIACKGNHMSVTILTIVTILSCRKIKPDLDVVMISMFIFFSFLYQYPH